MITIKKRQSLFTVTENWFGYKFHWSDFFLPVCYRGLREMNQELYFGIKKYTKTIVLPINKSINDIYAGFSTTLKYEIKKAEAEGVQCYFNNDRKAFIEFYNDFAKSKKLATLNIDRNDKYCGDIWKASYAVLNGQILVAHSYLEDKESGIVRLMESGSMRLNEKFDPKQIGQANKLLHHFDIKFFKEGGLQFYDFGGWDNLPGLLKFKQAFGAYPINIFNYFSYSYAIKDRIKEIMISLKRE